METKTVKIANGIGAQVRVQPTMYTDYIRKQAACEHKQIDPRGTCYACGKRDLK